MDQKLNVKVKSIQTPGGNTGENLHGFEVGKKFLYAIRKAQA